MKNISEITFKEGAGLWDEVMPEYAHKPFSGNAIKFDTSDTSPARVVFMSGCERLGIYFDGRVWADSDLEKIELDQQKVTAYLEGIGICQKQEA